MQLEKAGRRKGSIEALQQAAALRPNPKVAARIARLEREEAAKLAATCATEGCAEESVTVFSPLGGLCEAHARGAANTRAAPKRNWRRDSAYGACQLCAAPFTKQLFGGQRRHHCRKCGKLACAACTSFFAPMPELFGNQNGVRVCRNCFTGQGWTDWRTAGLGSCPVVSNSGSRLFAPSRASPRLF